MNEVHVLQSLLLITEHSVGESIVVINEKLLGPVKTYLISNVGNILELVHAHFS